MVTVRTVDTPRVQQAATPNADIGTRASASAFGADIGRGIQDLASGLDKMSDARERERIREQLRADEAAINGAATRMNDRQVSLLVGDDENTGFLDRSMEDALENRKPTLEGFDKGAEEERMSLTEGQRALFDERIARDRVSFRSQVERHTNKNAHQVEKRNLDTSVATSHKKAIVFRNDRNAVISELGEIAAAERTYGAVNGTTQEETDRRINLRAGALWGDVVNHALKNDELDTAAGYLEDFMVTDTMDPIVLEKAQADLENRAFIRDTRTEVEQIVGQAAAAEDFTQEALDQQLDLAVDKYGDDPQKLDTYKKFLSSSWADAGRAKRVRDSQYMDSLLESVNDPDANYTSSLNEAMKAPDHLRSQALAAVDRKFAVAETGADIVKDPFQQNMLKEAAINAIRSGEIESVGELNNLIGDKLNKTNFDALAKWFDPQAQVAEKEFDTSLESAIRALDPIISGGEEMREAKAEVRDHVEKVLGGAAPEPERIKTILQSFKMEFTPVRQEIVNGQTQFVESDVDVDDTPEAIASNFGTILPVIPEDKRDEVLERMQKDGFDPKRQDPRKYYSEIVLGRPAFGENTFGVEAKAEARAFIQAQRDENLQAASTELANQTIRNRVAEARYRGVDGNSEVTGSRAMILDLRDQSQRGLTPDWMREYIMQGPNRVDASGNEISSFQLYLRRLNSLPEGQRSQFIQSEGSAILEASKQ